MTSSYKTATKRGLDKLVKVFYNGDSKMMTKKIQRRNENIRLYRKERKMTYRALARMFKLSHTQIANIVKEGKVNGLHEM